jgi:hypothetical protein
MRPWAEWDREDGFNRRRLRRRGRWSVRRSLRRRQRWQPFSTRQRADQRASQHSGGRLRYRGGPAWHRHRRLPGRRDRRHSPARYWRVSLGRLRRGEPDRQRQHGEHPGQRPRHRVRGRGIASWPVDREVCGRRQR